jgi:hypothetical protein
MQFGGGAGEEQQRSDDFLRMTARREKPADLSAGRPTKRALVIRPESATVLGVTMLQPILIRTETVIQ